MAFVSFQEFKDFITSLLKLIIKKGDTKAAALQVKLDKMSADLTAANTTIQELQTSLGAADAAKTAALAAQAAAQLAELDKASTDLAAEFNPTPVADSVSEAVAEAPKVETPLEVAGAKEIGTGDATPPAVAEAAVKAIVEAAPIK